MVASENQGSVGSLVNFIILTKYCELYWKDENKEKEDGNGPRLKTVELRGIQTWIVGKECDN